MTLVMVGGIVLLLGVTVVVLRALNRIDDVYSRLPHDRDLQELFRHHMKRAQKMEEELTRWVLSEVDPDSLMKLFGLREQEALDTALGLCCLFGLGPPVMFLIEQGAKFDSSLSDPAPEIICSLARKRGIVVREADLQGSTALHLCALCGHPELTELLCKLGADPSKKNKHGARPLQLVSQCSSSNCVCISNKLWSFGCRTVRTRRILRSARARQSCYMLRFLFPALFDCIFGDGYLASRGRNEVSVLDSPCDSRLGDLHVSSMKSRRLGWKPLLTISGLATIMSLSLGIVWGDPTAGRNVLASWQSGQMIFLSGTILLMLYSTLSFLSAPGDASVSLDEPIISEISPVAVNGATARENICLASPVPGPAAVAAKVSVEREQDKRVAQLEIQWKQANDAFEADDFQLALSLYNEMAGGVLRWLDQDRCRVVRTRQRDCCLGIAELHSRSRRHIEAVKWYCDVLTEHAEILTREQFVSARLARDKSIVAQLRLLSEPEQCADMHASLGRLNDLQRPTCIEPATWAAWKRRDRSVLSQLLEARMEQGRDLSKGGSPALLVGVAKFEAALKACDKIGSSNCEGMGDCVDLAVEVLLWMTDACEIVANSGHGESNLSSCKRAIELVESALKLMEGDLKHCRYQLCRATLRRLEERASWQLKEQEREAAEALEVQRVLEEQRRLEEEARAQKKAQQEEKAKKAREERLRKEQEKKQQQQMEKEEALRKKAEEAAARKKEAEEKRRKDELMAQQEEADRLKRESEERRKFEAQERALAQAIAEAKARKEAQEKEKEKEKEKEREKAAKEQSKKKHEERDRKSQVEVKKGNVNPNTEKEDRQKAAQQMSEGLYEEAIQSFSRVLVSQGSKMAKGEYNKLVDQQRFCILQCVRKGASHSFGLSLPAAMSETRDLRKDPVDEVLVRLALGELEEALSVCDRAQSDPIVSGVNLKAEVLMSLAAASEAAGKTQQAISQLSKAIKSDSTRRKELEPVISRLQARVHSSGGAGGGGGGTGRAQNSHTNHGSGTSSGGAGSSTSDQRKGGHSSNGGGGSGNANPVQQGAQNAAKAAAESVKVQAPPAPAVSSPSPVSATNHPSKLVSESPLADLGWASTGLGPLAAGNGVGMQNVGAVLPDYSSQLSFASMGLCSPGYPMQGNGMEGQGLRQGGMMGGMMNVRGSPGNGSRVDYVCMSQGGGGGGMGGYPPGAMMHAMPSAGGGLGPQHHHHMAMGQGMMSNNGMRVSGGMNGGMVGGMGSNGFLMQPFESLSQDSLSSGGLSQDTAGLDGFHSGMGGGGFSHLGGDAFLGNAASSNSAFIGRSSPGGHKRSNSTDNMGLDEILSMPWLAEDHDVSPCASSTVVGGAALGGGSVTPLGNSLSGRLHLPGSDQWSPGGDVRW